MIRCSRLNHYVERSLLVSVCVYRSCLHLCLIVCVGVRANVHMLVWVLECTVCHKGYNKSSGAKGNVTHQLSALNATVNASPQRDQHPLLHPK